jgi:hypothetical protein
MVMGERVNPRNRHIPLVLLVLAVTLGNVFWISIDTRPQPFRDPYPHRTLEFIDNLGAKGLGELPQLVDQMSFKPRSPLYQLLTVPFVLVLGRSADSMLAVNLIFYVILILSTYALAKTTMGHSAGLLAAVLVASYPPIVNLVRIARPPSVAPACVALSMYLLSLTLVTRKAKWAWAFGFSLGFALLIHPILFYVLPLPALMYGSYMLLDQGAPGEEELPWRERLLRLKRLRNPFLFRGLVPAALIAMLLAGMWYLPNMAHIERLLGQLSGHWASVTVGFRDVSYSFWWYFITMPGAITNFNTVIIGSSLVYYLIKREPRKSLLAISFLLIYCAINFRSGAKSWLYFSSALPVAAVLSAGFLLDVRSSAGGLHRWLAGRVGGKNPLRALFVKLVGNASHVFSVAILPFSIVIAAAAFSVSTCDSGPGGRAVVKMLVLPLDPSCDNRMAVAFCPNAPVREDYRFVDIIRKIGEDPECRQRRCSLTIVPWRNSSVNRATLGFALLRDLPDFELELLANRGRRFDAELRWLISDYILYIPNEGGGLYSEAIVSLLEDPPEAFLASHQEVARFPLPKASTAILLQRTSPLTLQEARTTIGRLDLPSWSREDLLAKVNLMFKSREKNSGGY